MSAAELVNTETGEVIEPMSPTEAEDVTGEIRAGLLDIAETYESIMPKIRDALTRQAFDALGYRSAGEYISREFGGALHRLGVEARRGVVKELAEAGMSTRAIAPVVGTDQSTVTRDLQRGDASASPDQNQNVVGLDGKTYQRPKPAPVTTRQETEEHRAQRAAEHSRGLFLTQVAESLRYLSGGAYEASRFITDAYPHEVDHLAPGMRLTRARVDSSIEFLQTIRDEINP